MKNKILPIVFFSMLSTLLVSLWFKDGLMYGGGDVGLPSYNPSRILEIVSNVWWEASAPGFPLIYGVTAVPFYTILSLVQRFQPDPVSIQMILFGALLFLMGTGMYLVADDFWEGKNNWAAILSAWIYIFSPYLMIQVWHRFVHTSIYLAAILPFLFLFWKRWIRGGDGKSLILFSLISFLAAVIFSTLGFIVAFWLFIGLFTFCEIFIPWQGKSKTLLISGRFIFGIVLWLVVSLWWLLPVVLSIPTVLSQQHSSSESISTLLALSNQSVVPNVLQGVNPFYLFQEREWGDIYSHPFFLFLPWLMVSLAIMGSIKSLTNKTNAFWGLSLVSIIFLSKGAAAPFGNAFLSGFSNLFWLGVLRNPYEKLGIFIPFAQAILIPLGIGLIHSYFKNEFIKKTVLMISMSIVLVNVFVWGWPFWLGKIFGNYDYSAKVNIPDFYRQANEWFSKQTDQGVILHLPLTAGEAIAYSPEGGGYQGAEPSQLLFSTGASLSHGFNLKTVDQYLQTLQMMIRHIEKFDPNRVEEIFKSLNIKYVVVHLDVLTINSDIDHPERIKHLLERLPFLEKQAEFGPKIIYKANTKLYGMIHLHNEYDYLSLGKNNQLWPWVMKSENNILVSENIESNSEFISEAENIIIAPYISFNTPPINIVYKENLWGEMPPIRILPSSFVYSLISIKEWLETNSVYGRDRLIRRINFSSKRLVEAYTLALKKETKYIPETLIKYISLLDQISPQLETGLPFEKPVLEAIFTRQILAISELEKLQMNDTIRDDLVKAKMSLKKHLVELGLYPYHDLINEGISAFDRKVFEYQTQVPGEYYIAITDSINNYEDKRVFQINNKIHILDGSKYPSFVGYGPVFLDKGMHEISTYMKQTPVVIPDLESWPTVEGKTFTSTNIDPDFSEFSLPEITSGYYYRISFDYWVQKGSGVWAQVEQNTDPVKRGLKVIGFNRFYTSDGYEKYWKQASFSFKPKENSTQADLRLVVEPWDNCVDAIIAKNRKQAQKMCQRKEIKQQYQRPSQVVLRNIKINRLIEPQAFLLTRLPTKIPEDEPNVRVKYDRVSPVYYKGTFNTISPAFLVFSQTYDSGWKLVVYDDKDNIVTVKKALVNLFANGWQITTSGNYRFELSYTPQAWVKKGVILGGLSLLFLGFIYAKFKQKDII